MEGIHCGRSIHQNNKYGIRVRSEPKSESARNGVNNEE